MKKLRLKMILVLILSGILFSFVSSAYKPTQVQAISSKQRSVRKRTKKKRRRKKYFTRPGFEWDNRYLEVGKRVDLSRFVKGTTNLSKKNRARIIRWKSMNPSIMRINRYGVTKPRKEGQCRIRIKLKTRKGWKKIFKVIRIFDSRKVSFAVSLTLSKDNRFASKVAKSYNCVFDTISIRVANKSKKTVYLQKDILLCEPECSYVPNKDRKGVDVWMHSKNSDDLKVPAGKIKTFVYSTEGAVSYLKEDQKLANTYFICPFISGGVKRDFRYEMPTRRYQITR